MVEQCARALIEARCRLLQVAGEQCDRALIEAAVVEQYSCFQCIFLLLGFYISGFLTLMTSRIGLNVTRSNVIAIRMRRKIL